VCWPQEVRKLREQEEDRRRERRERHREAQLRTAVAQATDTELLRRGYSSAAAAPSNEYYDVADRTRLRILQERSAAAAHRLFLESGVNLDDAVASSTESDDVLLSPLLALDENDLDDLDQFLNECRAASSSSAPSASAPVWLGAYLRLPVRPLHLLYALPALI
jgi:hypothetical protein